VGEVPERKFRASQDLHGPNQGPHQHRHFRLEDLRVRHALRQGKRGHPQPKHCPAGVHRHVHRSRTDLGEGDRLFGRCAPVGEVAPVEALGGVILVLLRRIQPHQPEFTD